LKVAQDLFLRGERVDVNAILSALGIGKTTLYRWVGDREHLIGEVLAELTDRTWDIVLAEAEGEGFDRAIDAGRRFMSATANFPPLRQFAQRETQLALRVLLARDGIVAERIRAGLTRAFAENLPPDRQFDAELIDIAVQAGTALEWAPIAMGEDPEIERAEVITRSLLTMARAAGLHMINVEPRARGLND
jgi:AcrR family transcriptional regulator